GGGLRRGRRASGRGWRGCGSEPCRGGERIPGGGWRAGSCGWGRWRYTCEHIIISYGSCKELYRLVHENTRIFANLNQPTDPQQIIFEFKTESRLPTVS